MFKFDLNGKHHQCPSKLKNCSVAGESGEGGGL